LNSEVVYYNWMLIKKVILFMGDGPGGCGCDMLCGPCEKFPRNGFVVGFVNGFVNGFAADASAPELAAAADVQPRPSCNQKFSATAAATVAKASSSAAASASVANPDSSSPVSAVATDKKSLTVVAKINDGAKISAAKAVVSDAVEKNSVDILVKRFHWCFGSYNYALTNVYPKMNWGSFAKIVDRISKDVLKGVPSLCEEWLQKNTLLKKSDIRFLAEIGAVRNWKSGCAICLTEKIMGTTCGCGHTEIAVLRPCGHAICAKPCFMDMMDKMHGTKFEDKQIKTNDGHQLVIIGQKDINRDLEISCPLCRGKTTSVFRAEEVSAKSDPDLKLLVQKITQKFMADLPSHDHYLACNNSN
jgi:hypothetical protein